MNSTKNNTTFPQVVEIPAPLEIHSSVSPKAAELLLDAYERIAREPKTYNQGTGYVAQDCGSACCIFGHLHLADGGERKTAVISSDASRFGLTKAQGIAIYNSTKWPTPFKQKNSCAACPVEVGLARIEHFLRTGE